MSDTHRDREERQHVIEVLQEMVDWMQAAHYIVSKPERIHALFYAIASIKTDLNMTYCMRKQADKSITKNDLVVDKEQLKTMIRGLTKWYVKRDNTEVGEPNTAVGLLYDDVMFGIDRLPSVTPQEPKTGHWNDIPKYKDIAWHCSECGHFTTMKHNFCADCGCRMIEPQENGGRKMYLTPENAKDYVGMKLYADRSIFHCYPFTVFQYPDGTYATKDSAGVCSPVSNDLFNQVWFDRAKPQESEQ